MLLGSIRAAEAGQPLLDEAPFGVGVHELERTFVGGPRLVARDACKLVAPLLIWSR